MEEHGLISVLKTSDGRQVSIDEVLANRPAMVIGADARADLQLMGEGVAPSHAVITRSGADYSIAPRFPRTLVHVNNNPVKMPARLSLGDVIRLGSVQVTFAEAEGKPAPAQRGEVILPAVLPSGYAKPVTHPAAGPAAPAQTALASRGTVYYPRREQAGGGAGALLSGLTVLLIVGGVIGYSLFGAAAPSVAAGDLTSQFAYKDGNVTVVMFDADW